MIQTIRIANFLDEYFHTRQFPDEKTLIQDLPRPVRRLGLALESWAGLTDWAVENEIDALFLHRPWAALPDGFPAEIGVVSSHQGFDHRMTLGFNPRLAEALGMSAISVLGKKKDARAA